MSTPAASRSTPAGRLDATRCSVTAEARGDSPVGTASPAQRWLLVEQPGPWGRDALTQSRFDRGVAARLSARARAEGVRVLLVRRPGERLADTGRGWAYADGRPGREGLWWSVRTEDADLLAAPWDGSVGERAERPTYLVCTHGQHDACCALRGRPLARSMPAADVWECSHLGGCRFASNVLVLPHGFAYGAVPGDGADVVAAHTRGQVALPWLRGRAGLSMPAQAAQAAARESTGLLGVDDLPVRGSRRLPGTDAEEAEGVERFEVVLAGPAGDVVVRLDSRPSAEAVQLTCRATHPAHSRVWTTLSVTG
ncbi:sucrase ferredoxin [Geodermatophilus dictyosporus]|uniref:sucrase ferredoxin n=1 Tax=Geodermatophilus dictyosporus TaxID=1523247 RepID=UPI00145C2456|nr:sucrase ferredoxin [Geodermatophilus dictyosporus]